MSRIRSRDTKPELVVRRLLHAAGYRYRLHAKDLPGRPDIVFRGRRKAILIHGCFWHQHEEVKCLDGRRPKSNTAYWNDKLQRNVVRDHRNLDLLHKNDWEVLVVWECEMEPTNELLERLRAFLGDPRSAR